MELFLFIILITMNIIIHTGLVGFIFNRPKEDVKQNNNKEIDVLEYTKKEIKSISQIILCQTGSHLCIELNSIELFDNNLHIELNSYDHEGFKIYNTFIIDIEDISRNKIISFFDDMELITKASNFKYYKNERLIEEELMNLTIENT